MDKHMLAAAAALLLLCVAVRAEEVGCRVTQWSEWGKCEATTVCDQARLGGAGGTRSFSLHAAQWDQGRARMAEMVAQKNQMWRSEDQCAREGSCPEMRAMPTSSYRPCNSSGSAGEIPCRNVDQLSFVNFQDLGHYKNSFVMGNDIWGWTDPSDGEEYAIMGLYEGTSFVRITDPRNPVPLAYLETHTEGSSWRDIKVIDNYAYIVSEARGHGMQIFNLERLRNMTTLQNVTADVHYGKFGNSHNIVADEESKYVYSVGSIETREGYEICTGGLHIVDVSDPLNPLYAGCFGCDGYVHDAQCLVYRGPDSNFYGKQVCFCYNEDSFTIVDVDDKDDMHLISKRGYKGSQYTHQGWLTEDQATVLMDDELDEMRNLVQQNTVTYMWDVRDLSDPVLKKRYISSQTSIDHNQYTVGDLVYQANYEAGLRILRITADAINNNYDLEELAYFDVLPSRTEARFSGAWSVYPYFPSGNVIISSIDYGLFVVRPNYDVINNTGSDENAVTGEQSRTRKILHKEYNAECPSTVETRQCQAEC